MSLAEVRPVRVPRLNDDDSRHSRYARFVAGFDDPTLEASGLGGHLAAGNPFFLVQLSSHCRDAMPGNRCPDSLQIALERRIDALWSTAQLLLQACAVLAHNGSLARLEAMLGLRPHAMASALSELELSGLIATRDGWIGCRHDLIAEAVIHGLSVAVCNYLHRRVRLYCMKNLSRRLVSRWSGIAPVTGKLPKSQRVHSKCKMMIVDRLLSLGLPRAAADLCVRAERYCRTPDEHAERLLRISRAQLLV